MKLNFTKGTVIALMIASAAAFLYRSGYKKQLGINNGQITEIQQLNDTINYQNTHIEMLHELDSKYTQELANAKSKINQLSNDLRANTQRVYVKANCPVLKTTTTSSVGGSRPAKLAKDAEQDYVHLLGELETLEAQFLGLREWSMAECQF
ncbi:lysis protein [Xenorhabdus szentirmaii]|uniref:Rz endopeptidase from lambdoid prophage Rac n=1 Tax=Xenorhabdus szentirmaii DSM 16338 TaxID=1427518 RepID=W1IZB4_9GAMM|nr:lysis protein [Xenorhabdus szentirmaii]PHM33653.1 peptidase [Xenorhabdus szentirmaii DSM 16338]PHM42307.1 peptidase [Xenorhabdus szentirmaii]CDL83178.1 putative Rz endopeptidase from lambdoid prophage Rac [Xenorhabdus szentirmaii DSM 16338]